MNLLWFYVAVALAISDYIHGCLVWKIGTDFYIILGKLINNTVHSSMKTWLIHEIMESIFHFIVISIIFLSFKIGILAAIIHLILDIGHTLALKGLDGVPHRAFHFLIESLFFIIIFGL